MAEPAPASLVSRLAMLCGLWVAGCGRVGYELLPKPVEERDGGGSDAGDPNSQDGARGDAARPGCDGSNCGCPECGCGVAVTDGDGDGTPDCVDECPADANKSRAGQCGCGITEQDTELDATPDDLHPLLDASRIAQRSELTVLRANKLVTLHVRPEADQD